ncbi:hypothetical protein [Glycomyces amatae]|uniref:hypothetical protein n=1 Tax=Glycomyces amatae TaxID=2881355 RepID=UPI0034E26AB2
MCRAHGVESRFAAGAWAAVRRTPPLYPDAVTLDPGVAPDDLLARIDTGTPGASVKDGFADLDLRPAGFHVLFAAQWIHRPPGPPGTAPVLDWRAAEDADALRAWAVAWDGGQGHAGLWRPELLEAPEVSVLSGHGADGRAAAGAVATRRDAVVGVSNVFGADAWPGVLDTVHRRFPGLPVVGYEHGGGLAAAERHGFAPIGPLRVWLRG